MSVNQIQLTMLPPSDAYNLTVRQEPQRAKAFAGPKEKGECTRRRHGMDSASGRDSNQMPWTTDRKPVDPPPIIQLQISDPADPAQNYLQSPYFFMCCNLCDANLDRPGQLAAAQQGDDLDTASQAALAGTLVSSLHRLKDIDNSDGGFFVFPDVSVRIEGDFRLRFSLFEMLKNAPKVIYIKSITSAPFTVHTPRTFPGMLESTFLSRSFGDQGVKLRIRKEPRVLGKRSAPSDLQPPDVTHGHRQPIVSSYGNTAGQSQHNQSGGFGSATYSDQAAGYNDPHPHRHLPAVDLSTRAAYEQERRAPQHVQQRDPYGTHQAQDVATPNRASFYSQGASSAPSSDYSFGHQRTGSSTVSSPFVSPHHEYPGYSYAQPSQIYHQPRDAGFRQPYDQYANLQSRQIPQLAQPVPSQRQLASSLPTQTGLTRAYPQSFEALGATVTDPRASESLQSSRSYYHQPYASSQTGQSLARTLPASAYTPSPAGLLPPLASNVPSGQARSDNLQAHSSGLLPSMESSAPYPSGSLPGRDSQRHGSGSYRNPPNG